MPQMSATSAMFPAVPPKQDASRRADDRVEIDPLQRASGDPGYTVQISIAFLRLSIGSCPSAGEYSWVTNPVKPRSAIACITNR